MDSNWAVYRLARLGLVGVVTALASGCGGDAASSPEVAGLDPVTISATAIVPTDIVIAQGNNQSGACVDPP